MKKIGGIGSMLCHEKLRLPYDLPAETGNGHAPSACALIPMVYTRTDVFQIVHLRRPAACLTIAIGQLNCETR